MRQFFRISFFVFTLILSKNIFCQVVWQENFAVPDKGVWADSIGAIHTDLTDIGWTIEYEGCIFSDESDYAKTVATAGGRFEVLDSDGEVVWTTDSIDISTYDAINISLDASETGSSEGTDKKYLKAYYKINGGEEMPFVPLNEALGNWGILHLKHNRIKGDVLQVVVRMNSSYASDKVILDNVTVEAIDSSSFVPTHIQIIESPLFAFSNDTALIRAIAYNAENAAIVDSTLQLNFVSTDILVSNSSYKDGVYSWNVYSSKNGELKYSIFDEYNLMASSDSMILFFTKLDAKVIEEFERTPYNGWQINSDWEVSNVEPISGTESIKHALENVSGKSELIYDGSDFKLAEEEFLFSFKLKNGSWDPSSTNLFYLWLKSKNESDPEGGYAIGVNASGSSDMVSLWKVKGGVPGDLIAETQFDWDESTTAQINVMRSATGDWILNVNNLVTGETSITKGVDSDFKVIDELSLVFEYTTTRAGKLWFDDLIVIGQNAAPFIANAKAIADGKFQVFFNEDIQMEQLTASNLKLTSKGGQNYPIQSIEKVGSNSVVINAANVLEPYLVVTVTSIADLEGKTTAQFSFSFENALPALTSDIIINEIMADPNPPVGLPEAEYIEIYNRSNHYIELENWELFVRNTSFKLPAKLIGAGEYLTICDDAFGEQFKSYGNVLAMKDFPALLNSGATLRISTPENVLVDEVIYSDDWYFDPAKENGGYSLERIDRNRFCGQRGNWRASVNEKGGTPGKANSIIGDNVDLTAPQFLAVDIVSYTEIQLIFDEPLDSAIAQQKSNYSIQGLSIAEVKYIPGELTVKVILGSSIKLNTEYNCTVRQMMDECGNSTGEAVQSFTMVALDKGQVLINEVLFNPFTGGSDFVELYNNSGYTIDLADLKLATRDDSLKLKSVYKVSNLHAQFHAGDYMAFTKDTLSILQNYNVPYPDHLRQMSSYPSYNNTEGRVVVLNDSLVVLDEFAYNENMHSQWLTSYDGVSLERLSAEAETNDPANWQSASSLVGYATPGYKNSQSEIVSEQKLGIELESDVVSPNGDGYNDELIIKFLLDKTGYLANVYIFDAYGREVKRLTNNDLIGNNLEVVYDLRNANGGILPMGSYVIFTELVHMNVKKRVFKNAFLVTDKL